MDASRPHGKGGEWLLDPNNITINTTADANVAGSPNFVTTDDSAVVTVNSIQTALNAGTSVSITTGTAGANTQNGDITVASSIAKTAGGDATLTLKAHRNITVNAGVGITSNTGKLNMVFHADGDAVPNQDGAVQLGNGTFTTNGGDFTIGGGANPAHHGGVWQCSHQPRRLSQQLADQRRRRQYLDTRQGICGQRTAMFGIYNSAATVQTNGSGTITAIGTGGGDGTGKTNYGVLCRVVAHSPP